MADNNQNRSSYASDENWDKNQGRYVDDNNYNQQSSYNPNNLDLDRDGNIGSTGGFFGGTNYIGSSVMGGNYIQNDEQRRSQNWQNEKPRNYQDSNYENRQGQGSNYGQQARQDYNRNYQQGQYGNTGNQQYGGQQNYNRNEDFRRQDYNQYNQQSHQGNRNQWPEDYRYGNTSHYGGGNQGQGEYPQNYGYSSGVGHINDQGGHGDWGRENRNRGAWNDNRAWDNRNTNYRNDQRERRDDRSWWDRTRDEVASWFGDDDAERRRRSDEQRTGEHKGKGPKQYSRSDTRIHEDVCDRLSEDSYVDASDIEVKVENGEVTLSGTVDNRAARRRAEDLVDSISGVKHVQNNIRIGQAMTVGSTTIKSSAVQNTSGKASDTSSNK